MGYGRAKDLREVCVRKSDFFVYYVIPYNFKWTDIEKIYWEYYTDDANIDQNVLHKVRTGTTDTIIPWNVYIPYKKNK